MAFIDTDLYLASGTGGIINSWTPNVYKFNSSSFYNWEQDNEPIYDLEERTSYLWEKLGFPVEDGFSGIPGIMFAVSADAPFVGESSGIIFKSVSSVINILPEIITIPIIIEVANFGDLGELNLQNLKFKDRGGLEIINRNFAKLVSYDSSGGFTKVNTATNISALDGYNTLHNSKCLSINTLVTSAIFPSFDARYEGKNILYALRGQSVGVGTGANGRPPSAILSINCDNSIDGAGTFDGATFIGTFTDVPRDHTYDFTVSSNDIVVYNQTTTPPAVLERTAYVTTNRLVGFVFGNWFTKVVIKNCNGPIFIRNFSVDGGTGREGTLSHNTENGFEIENSKLVLENVLATRCKKTGFRISNSDVIFNRGVVAIRNYTLDSPTVRNSYKSAGLRAINSNITVSSSTYASGLNNIYQFSKNAIGIDLFGSRWTGGSKLQDVVYTSAITYIQTFCNTDIGFKATQSFIEIPGRLDTYNNDTGCELTNTEMLLNLGTFEQNQTYGLKADNSHIIYNQDLNKYAAQTIEDLVGQMHFKQNGINILLDNSDLAFESSTNIPNLYGKFYVQQSIGVENEFETPVSLPNLQIFNGSNAKLVHPYITNDQTNLKTNNGLAGICASVRNNSKLVSIGSRNDVAFFVGPPTYLQQQFTANLYANNASIIEFQGPTFIGNAGVGVLAEDHSIINFNPHRDDHGNILVRNYNLSDSLNHSKIEIHSTRACLVANRDSIINMINLGDINAFWGASLLSAVDFNLNDTGGFASAVSGGYMQFYPNGQDGDLLAASGGRIDITDATYGNPGFTADPVVDDPGGFMLAQWNGAASIAEISKYSTGGMCLRALNGSIVNSRNVHFPTGWDNTSGIVYDASSGNCDLLRIWNIGPDSKLNAAYCSVSSMYPSLAGYYGPSAVYLSGGVPASGAPGGTPDTDVLSVLDSYGVSGLNPGTNYGPFRLYVSVDGPGKFLNYTSGGSLVYNYTYQTWAQGYNPSGSVSAAVEVSAYYNDLTVTSFPTTSAMLDASFRDNIRLDQSAADMFANAKSGALKISGRIPICTIYNATVVEGGEGFDSTAVGYGIGLLSVNIFDLFRVN